jgi:hypothetical protein
MAHRKATVRRTTSRRALFVLMGLGDERAVRPTFVVVELAHTPP